MSKNDIRIMLFATFSIDIFKITISYYLTYYYYHYYFSPKEWLYKFVTKNPIVDQIFAFEILLLLLLLFMSKT